MVTPVWYRGSLPQSNKRPPTPPWYGVGGRPPGWGGAQRLRPLGESWELRQQHHGGDCTADAEGRLIGRSGARVGLPAHAQDHVLPAVVAAHTLRLPLAGAGRRRVHPRALVGVVELVIEADLLPPQPGLPRLEERLPRGCTLRLEREPHDDDRAFQVLMGVLGGLATGLEG